MFATATGFLVISSRIRQNGPLSHRWHWKAIALPDVGLLLYICCMRQQKLCCCFSVMSYSLQPLDCNTPGFPGLHYLPEFSQTHVDRVSDAIQPSDPVTPFSFCHQSFPASGSFPVSWLFASDGHNIGVSASASVLPMNIQGGFPLGWIGLILYSTGLSRVFSNTTVQKHQFFSTQLSMWSNSHNYT